MSFPYTTTAPPPTNGALPIVESANLSAGPYSGGGGGGGGGPNPSVSTLTFAPFSVGSSGYINMDGFMAVFDSGAGTPAAGNYTLGIQAELTTSQLGSLS